MIESEVVELMESSNSEEEWRTNVDTVIKNCNGYPEFWYELIMLSGIADKTAEKWGGDMGIHTVKSTD